MNSQIQFSNDVSSVAVAGTAREATSSGLPESPAESATSSACLKLRCDLIASPHNGGDDAGGVVLKDPAAGRFFRFRETEGFILQQLDGYYLLSDWLGIPNLRGKSTQYLRAAARATFGRAADWPAGATARERRICVIYGLLAAAFVTWLLSTLALRVGGHLVRQYQAWGFVCFAALLCVVFRNSI